jgi:hypothetical protein
MAAERRRYRLMSHGVQVGCIIDDASEFKWVERAPA